MTVDAGSVVLGFVVGFSLALAIGVVLNFLADPRFQRGPRHDHLSRREHLKRILEDPDA